MRQKLLSEAAELLVKNRRRRVWTKAVGCMAAVVVFCTTYALILPALTIEKDTVCGYVEHIHTEECYQPGTMDASDGNAVKVVSDGNALESDEGTYCGIHAHQHTTECFGDSNPTADVETEEEWKASFADASLTGNWAQDLVAIAQSQIGYAESEDNFFYNTETKKLNGYTRYGAWYGDEYGDWNAMFVAFCLNYAQVTDYPVDVDCAKWVEALSQEEYDLYREADEYTPVAGDLIFFDTAKDDGEANYVGIVEEVTSSEESVTQLTVVEGDSSDQVKRVTYKADDASILGYGILPAQLTAEEQEQVNFVISLIDEMPSADEIDAKMAEFEDAEDYEGEEAWLTEVYQQVARAYYHYNLLTEEQKLWITNADKLLELEYIWSMTTYQYKDSTPIYQVNAYSKNKNILLYGTGVNKVITSSSPFTSDWYAYVIKWNSNGYWYLSKYVASGTSKVGLDPGTDGFILLLYGSSWGKLDSASVSGTVYVTLNFDFTEASGYKAAGFGNVTFGTNAAEGIMKKTNVQSDKPTVVQSAKTSNFIDLNLYNYGSNINYYWSNNRYSYVDWRYNTRSTSKYPGFQWNGGAYKFSTDSTGYAKRTAIDNIDFGNSLITDFSYSGSDYGKSTTATDVTFFADSGTYGINAMDYYYDIYDFDSDGITTRESQKYGINNRPIGYSIGTSITSTNYDVMQRTLGSDGYPALASGESLGYLFGKTAIYAKKQNTTSIDGLFQYEEKTGAYWYNSRWNHAQYSNNKFTLYDEIITPNLIAYPFGNFLPFNDITDRESATQVSKITSMGNYIQYFMNQLWSYYNAESYGTGVSIKEDATKAQLYYMLNQYKQNISNSSIHSKSWSTFSANDAIWDYLTGGGKTTGTSGAGDNPTDTYPITDSYLEELYNIDYDVEKDFFFGMDMTMEFYMPKDGWVGKDNGDNSNPLDSNHDRAGDPDGIPDQPMIFSFTGDDDVWVYVDGVLFLDLSGIHRHVGGRINYTEGKVYYYYLDVESGDIDTENPYATYTFAQILKAAGKDPADYLRTDASGNYTTFKDYSTHIFKFYYMERGSGSSICSINFNFPLVEHNSITVSKELTDDSTDIEALGNPDFTFQVLDADDTNFLRSNQAYSLYDTDGSVIQEVHVTEEYQDGRIKTIQIKDKDGNVICTEMYNSSGVVETTTGSNVNGVLRIKDDGSFTLKAGQTATFVGIDSDAGQYYVREVLRDDLKAQYGTISITGSASKVIDSSGEFTEIGDFVGADSTAQYASNSHIFRYENKISTAKLGKLSITKKVSATTTQDTSNTIFKFKVTLDGEPLPDDTSYTVGGETKNAVDGYIELKDGQTVVISNIIAGSQFEVTETADSSEGYIVSYSVNGTTQSASSATGTIGIVDNIVAVTVNNAERGDEVTLNVKKALKAFDGTERTYEFQLKQVTVTESEDGTTISHVTEKADGTTTSQTITVKDSAQSAQLIDLSYQAEDVALSPFYYQLSEVNNSSGDTRTNNRVYVIKVTVSQLENGQVDAVIEKIWTASSPDTEYQVSGATIDDDTATITYSNVVVNTLVIGKKVEGSTDAQKEGYTFEITLTKGVKNGESVGKGEGADLSNTYPTILTHADGTTTEENTKFPQVKSGDSTVRAATITLKHGETFTIKNLPIGTTWKVTETNLDGFKVTYSGTVSGEGSEAGGTITKDGSTVTFTNTQLYELPETGGIGTTSYTMAGLILLLSSAAYLMYIRAKRRKEVS